ncbi:hypothetical protein [Cohnella rhizosphaerae]|uniref:Uncharacterized protein n=1 Tax=Cohnella rhizosphaerae TaxID=1457232 RepID=A0A9X4KNX2_9BACL|nr:hypothetical protein [Cohnella rhizosphaerae]MDG0808070.1 hypothetical protein [Cohnella rhizosphaerae]
MKLVEPIFDILNDQVEIFENHWKLRSTAYDFLREEDIQDILRYTKQKLIELQNYLNAVKEKKTKDRLQFYKEHVELLLRYHQNKFDSYPGTYMYLYSELILGAQRYQNIKDELRRLDSDTEEVGSIT